MADYDPHRPGMVKCLGFDCNNEFLSPDKAARRLCPVCQRKREKEFQAPAFKVYRDGKQVLPPD